MTDFSDALIKNPETLFFCRIRNSLSTPVEEETVLLNMDTGVYNCLDPVGSTIWHHLKEPISFAELRRKILAEYEVSDERCSSDIQAFLEELHSHQLIEITQTSCK